MDSAAGRITGRSCPSTSPTSRESHVWRGRDPTLKTRASSTTASSQRIRFQAPICRRESGPTVAPFKSERGASAVSCRRFAFLLVLATTSASIAQTPYICKEGKYKIGFPDAPKETTKDAVLASGETLTLHLCTFEVAPPALADEKAAYVASYCEYPAITAKAAAQ